MVTQPVTVITEHDDGAVETNRGLGFALNGRFYTTRHTIPERGESAIFVNDMPVAPLHYDDVTDLAILEIPARVGFDDAPGEVVDDPIERLERLRVPEASGARHVEQALARCAVDGTLSRSSSTVPRAPPSC